MVDRSRFIPAWVLLAAVLAALLFVVVAEALT